MHDSFVLRAGEKGEELRLSCKVFSGLRLCRATHGFEVGRDKGDHLRGRTPPTVSIASEEEFIYLRLAAALREVETRMFQEGRKIFTDTTKADQLW